MIHDFDHIAIAVKNIQDSLKLYRDLLGMELLGLEEVKDQKVLTAMLQAGSQRVELLEPSTADSPVGKFLEKRGGGIHHIAFRVSNIRAAIAACQQLGLRMIDEAPRPGAGGTQIAFIHPKSTGGVLIELTQ